MLVHPQSQLIREPRLLVPRMVPLGPVRIDWKNSLTTNLEGCFINKAFHSKKGSKYSKSYMPPTMYGPGRIWANWVPLESQQAPIFPKTFNSLGPATIFCVALKRTTDDDGLGSFCAADYSANMWMLWCGAGNPSTPYATFYAGGADRTITAVDTIQNGSFFTLCGRATGTTQSFFVNGKNQGGDTSYSTGGISYLQAFEIGGTYQPLFAVFGWTRALSDGEIAGMARDPYQFLIPA